MVQSCKALTVSSRLLNHCYPIITINPNSASQPMWPLNDQISKIAQNLSCPTGRGQLDCLRQKSGVELQKVLLATGTQFQPVTDNVTIFKE